MMQPASHRQQGLLGLLAVCIWAHTAMAQALPTPVAEAGIDALYSCFRAATLAAANAGPAHADGAAHTPVPFGPGSELFFFEQLGAALQAQGGPVQPAWCEAWFVAPYLRAHAALHGAMANEVHSPVLPLATGAHLAAESRLIHLAARMGGVSHVSAHADMVRRAISQPKLARQLARLHLDACARGLLMQAAQMPDLYLFAAPTWHARSRDGVGVTSGDLAATEADRTAFVAQVVAAIEGARAALRDDNTEAGMLLLGAAAHAVQDLTFHRGMTLAEQSGLTYVAHSNPDLPAEPAYPKAIAQATAATAEVLARALAPLPTRAARPIAQGLELAENEVALAQLVRAVWPGAQAVTHAAMRAYYDLARAYRPAGAPSLAAANLGRWPVPATLDAVLAGL